MCPNIALGNGLGVNVRNLIFSRDIPKTTLRVVTRKDLVEPVEIHATCSMYMPQLGGPALEQYLDNSFVIIGDNEINRLRKLSYCENVLHMVEPKRNDRHYLSGNRK